MNSVYKIFTTPRKMGRPLMKPDYKQWRAEAISQVLSLMDGPHKTANLRLVEVLNQLEQRDKNGPVKGKGDAHDAP